MSERTTSKGRWRSIGRWLLLALVAVVVGQVGWSLRPLNRAERKLIGGWEQVGRHESSYDINEEILWFREDRRFEVTRPLVRRLPTGSELRTQDVIQRGEWGASSVSLFKTFEVAGASRWTVYSQKPVLLLYRLIGRNRTRYPFRFDGPDRVWINEVEFKRVGE